MQAEIQTKVKISVSEIKKIIAEKFCLYHDFEVEIVADSVVEYDSVNKENNDWIDVPVDWVRPCCPTNINNHELIDVKFRCGQEKNSVSPLAYGNSWIQECDERDIVKYRISSKNPF